MNGTSTIELADKGALITGAAGGIGLGLAKAALDRGMKVVIADLDGAKAEEAAAVLRANGGRVTAHACDVRDLAQVEALLASALADMGRVDLACNNAGIGLTRPVTECTPGDWQLLFDVNVAGVTNGVRALLPHFTEQGSGHLNATASLSGLVGDPDLAIYNSTKFAVVGLMEAIALEMHRDQPGVTASVLCPGPVATDLLASSGKALADAGSEPSDNDAVAAYLAGGMHPDDVGRFAIEGIAEGRFWLLPHPELTFELMDPRYQAMKSGQLFIPPDWTEQ